MPQTLVRAARIREFGGPEVIELDNVALDDPGPREVRVRHTAIGLNFIDTYHRTGLYAVPLTSGLGVEAAGIVEALGDEVNELAPGDRVAYVSPRPGAYAQAANVPADRVVSLPPVLPEDIAAAALLKGLTVHFLLGDVYPVKPGDTILVQAAAGGVGLILCQWAKVLGATVIGTVGSPEKAELACANGCDHAVLYRDEDFVAKVKDLTGNRGVPVVYDSVGAATLLRSLECVARRGVLVSFGNASGAPPAIDLFLLAQQGSISVTRPALQDFIVTREEMTARARDLFDVLAANKIHVHINQRYRLDEVRQAHADLEGRQTSAASVIIP